MEFKLFSKLASLEGIELYMLLGGLIVLAGLIWAVAVYARRAKAQAAAEPEAAAKPSRTQTLVYGALSITLAFVLSYFKLVSLPFGGTVTLLSMLPIFAYAAYFGPIYGFTAAFAFSLLQVVQGAYIVHPVQFILDYFVAFTLLGTAAFFPKNLPVGAAVAGFLRMIASTVTGSGVLRLLCGGLRVYQCLGVFAGLQLLLDRRGYDPLRDRRRPAAGAEAV